MNERLCVSLPPYYMEWVEKYYPNVTLNIDDGPFCLRCINEIHVTKSAGQQWNCLLET